MDTTVLSLRAHYRHVICRVSAVDNDDQQQEVKTIGERVGQESQESQAPASAPPHSQQQQQPPTTFKLGFSMAI
jgi:hypothetical protein